MSSIFKKKRELYLKWAKLYDILDSHEMKYEKYLKGRKIEQKYYEEWLFYNNFIKAKEKVENEKRKKN